jgi:hypothetical protein
MIRLLGGDTILLTTNRFRFQDKATSPNSGKILSGVYPANQRDAGDSTKLRGRWCVRKEQKPIVSKYRLRIPPENLILFRLYQAQTCQALLPQI